MRLTIVAVCLVALVVAAAAQYGGGDGYGDKDGAAAPSAASTRAFTYPTLIIGLLPFSLAFFALK